MRESCKPHRDTKRHGKEDADDKRPYLLGGQSDKISVKQYGEAISQPKARAPFFRVSWTNGTRQFQEGTLFQKDNIRMDIISAPEEPGVAHDSSL